MFKRLMFGFAALIVSGVASAVTPPVFDFGNLLNPPDTEQNYVRQVTGPQFSTFSDYYTFTMDAPPATSGIFSGGVSRITLTNRVGLSFSSVVLTGGPSSVNIPFVVDSAGNYSLIDQVLSTGANIYNISVSGTITGSLNKGNYTASVIAAVPEPHEWAMMLAGLGMVGTIAARRRAAAAATA